MDLPAAQGVETWETTRPKRWTISLAILPSRSSLSLFARQRLRRAVPRRRTRMPAAAPLCGAASDATPVPAPAPLRRALLRPILNRDSRGPDPIRPATRDLLLFLPVDTANTRHRSSTPPRGATALEAPADPAVARPGCAIARTLHLRNDSGPETPDGRHLRRRAACCASRHDYPPTAPGTSAQRYPLHIAATYAGADRSAAAHLRGRAGVNAHVGGRHGADGARSARILPLFCFGAAFARWRRTR